MADRSVSVSLILQAQGYMAGIQKASEETRKLGSEAEKLAAKREGFDQLGTAVLGVGAGLTAVTGLAVKAASDWESAWAGVTKTVDGTDAQMREVEDGLRGLTSVLPAAHGEIAAVAEAAGQLGVQTDNVVGFTRTMVDLGETTNLSANDAATALARFTNIMGTSQGDVDRLGSALVGLGNNYATTESEILEMAMRLAGAGKQINLSEGEVLGLSTALSSVGIEAEAGGSAMSKVMIDIAASVEEGGERVEMFAQTAGMSAEEFSEKWRTAPADALAAFVKGLANAESQGSSTLGILADLGITEVRMRDALLRSSSAADQFSGAMAQGNAEFEANNALTEEAAKRYETVESRVRIAMNAISDAAIDFGAVFLPKIAEAADGVAQFATFMGDLPAPLQDVIGVATGVVGVLALTGGTALLAVPKIAEFKTGLTTLGITGTTVRGSLSGLTSFLGGPWGMALVGAAAGVTALKFAIDTAAASSEEMQGALTNVEGAAEIVKVFTQGSELKWFTDVEAQFNDLDATLDKSADYWSAWWKRLPGVGYGSELGGFHDALSTMGEELATLSQSDLPSAQEAFSALAAETDGSREHLWQLLDGMDEYKNVLIGVAESQGINIDSMSEAERQATLLALAQTEVADTGDDSERAAREQAAALSELEGSAAGASEQIDELADKVRGFGSAALNTRDAHRQFEAAVDSLQEAIDNNERTLDRSTEAGRANESAIDDLAKSTLELAASTLEQTGNEEDAARVIRDGRAALEEKLEAFGLTGEAAQDYIDQLGLIPENIPQTVTLLGLDEANAALDNLARQREAMVKVTWSEDGTYGEMAGNRQITPNATGNLYVGGKLKEFAAGGWASGVGMVPATPGGLLKVAEAGYDEAIISTDPRYRARSLGLLDEMSARLGVFRPSPDYVLAGGGGSGAQSPVIGTLQQTINQRPGVSDRRIAQVSAEEIAFALK